MQFPLKLNVLSIEKFDLGCIECFFTIVDGTGAVVRTRNHFVCKATDFDVVAERFLKEAAQGKGIALVDATDPKVLELLATIRAAGQSSLTDPLTPTPLDQTISPPGPTPKKAVTK